MGVSNPDNPKHQRQSQILVPIDTPGVEILRMRFSEIAEKKYDGFNPNDPQSVISLLLMQQTYLK